MKRFVLAALLTGVFAQYTHSAGFEVFRSTWQGEPITYIICHVNNQERERIYRDMGLTKKQRAQGIFLKDFSPGTKVFVDTVLTKELRDDFSLNGYQFFRVPQDEYSMTIQRPDGSSLTFPLIKLDGPHLCSLTWEELTQVISGPTGI